MRKLSLSVVLFLGVSMISSVFAVDQKNVGAGLGTMLFQDHDGLLSHTLAATTNGICMNQLFAITSGTLGAEKPESIVKNDMDNFMKFNMDKVAKDIATGEGESLETLAEIMKVENNDAFRSKLQKNFAKIYSSDDIDHHQVTKNIIEVVNS